MPSPLFRGLSGDNAKLTISETSGRFDSGPKSNLPDVSEMVSFALSPERPLNKGLGMLQMSSAKVVLYFGQGERGMFVIFFDGTRYEIVPHARSTFEERDGWMIID